MGKKIRKKIKQLGNLLRKAYQRPGKKGRIVILSVMAASVIAVILLIVFGKGSSDTAVAEEIREISIEGKDMDAAADGEEEDYEDIPVVETATAGTKVESTEESTVLAKKEGAKEGYLIHP